MKKIYVSPVMVSEEILDDEIIATSGDPQMDPLNNAQEGGGDPEYSGDALSKGFSNFSFDDFGF